MALSVAQLYEVMAQLPDPVFILSEDGYYIEYIGGMEQQSYQNGNPLIVSIHRNSIDTGKMRRSSLDPTFLLA